MNGRHQPADVNTIRGHNLGIVMRTLRDAGPLSRIQIARRSGLVHASMTNLVADLESRGLVRPVDNPPADGRKRGRPATPLEIVPARALVLGVSITSGRVEAELTTCTGATTWSSRRALARGRVPPEGVASLVAELLREAAGAADAGGGVLLSCVIAMPAPVGSVSGEVKDAIDFGWRRVPLIQLIRQAGAPDGVELTLVSDANTAALAEFFALDRPRPRVAAYVKADVGVGGGVISDQKVFVGEDGLGGGVGHVTVDWRGRPCPCGSVGCVAAYAGPEPLAEAAAVSDVLEADGIDAAVDAILARAAAGDQRALEALAVAGRAVGFGVKTMCALLDPGVVILGGYLARLHPWIEPLIQEVIASQTALTTPLPIQPGRLDGRAVLAGAAQIGFGPFFDDPSIVPVLPES
ncbi:MAG: ROK family transcriptional regulator [Propionibacteriaceae bacterium]|jgi:predicted NBD/HSP70 family sugar kinase|nr:ROK family transcriptional regulator [Propionibacteriaceae bacterium]